MLVSVQVDNASLIMPGGWKANISRSDLRQLGTPATELGLRSVVLLDFPSFDEAVGRVAFSLNSARLINLGSSDDTIMIALDGYDAPRAAKLEKADQSVTEPRLAIGDRQLLSAVTEFSEPMQSAIAQLLTAIRQIDPSGDLKREGKRYVNRHDNFVAIEIQTRNKHLLINVRGVVPTKLPVVATLNGYTAFKLSQPNDLSSVVETVRSATMKRR